MVRGGSLYHHTIVPQYSLILTIRLHSTVIGSCPVHVGREGKYIRILLLMASECAIRNHFMIFSWNDWENGHSLLDSLLLDSLSKSDGLPMWWRGKCSRVYEGVPKQRSQAIFDLRIPTTYAAVRRVSFGCIVASKFSRRVCNTTMEISHQM